MSKLTSSPDAVSWREYVDERFRAIAESARLVHDAEQERAMAYKTQSELVAQAIEQRFRAVDKATELASAALDDKLHVMNEWRTDFDRQRANFPTRIELSSMLETLHVAIGNSEERIQAMEVGKLNISAHDTLEVRIQALEKANANFDGRMWAIGVGLTIVSIMVGVALHFIK